jgi:hypothetical protein
MAISVTHDTVVVVADDGTSPVGSDEWNAAHTVTGAVEAVSSTDNAVVRFDSTSGQVQDSDVLIDDSGNLVPDASDGGALGTTALQWSDLFVAEGGFVNWNNGQETIKGIVDTLSFSGDAGTFPTLYFTLNGTIKATLGGAWKSRNIKLSLPNYGSAADAIHVAGNSNGGGTVSFSRTANADPYTHTTLGDNSGIFLFEGFGSNQSSWDGAGAIRLSTDGVPGAAFPGNGLGCKWVFSLTPTGNTGYAQRFSLRADGTATTEYDTNIGPTNTVLYMMDYQFRTETGTPAAGIGIGLKFTLDTGGGNNEVGALMDVVATDVTGGSEDFDYVWKLMAAGAAAAEKMRLTSAGNLLLGSAGALGWSTDLFLVRDAAQILAQRNGTTAQGLRIYNTYTDASNHERASFEWGSNVFTIKTEKAGSGSNRELNLYSADNMRLFASSYFLFESQAGAEVARILTAGGSLEVSNSATVSFSSTSTAGSNDIGISRIAAGVLGVGNGTGASVAGWVQWAGQKRVAADFDTGNSTTLANITGLSVTLAAGRTYSFVAELYTTSDVAAGVKFAIGGTATATAIVYEAIVHNAGVLVAQTRATALATEVGAVTAVTVAKCTITGTITVNAAGTLTVQMAQNVGNATGSMALRGSSFIVHDMP